MKTTHAKIEFARLPKDDAGLCRILTPRPIHDEVEFQNVTEITDAMAGHKLTADQEDYFDLLCRLHSGCAFGAGKRQLFTVFAGCAMITTRLVMKVLDIPRSGKRGNMVWQSNRYGQYCYTGKFDQTPVGPTLFLRAHKLIVGWDNVLRQLAASALPPRRLTLDILRFPAAIHLGYCPGCPSSALFHPISWFRLSISSR